MTQPIEFINMNTNLVMDTTNYLSKEEFYKQNLSANTMTIIYNYHCLVAICLKYSIENITKLKRKQLDFVLLRGFDTITHVFLNLLFYTKNLEIVLLYCQKACYFYVEFVNQITDEQNNFLQLGSRDACIYVYKKIFTDIHREYYSNTINNDEHNVENMTYNETYFIITEYTKICKSILLHLTEFISFEPIHIFDYFKQLIYLTNYYSNFNKSQIHLYINWVCILNDLFNTRVNKNNFTNISNLYLCILLTFIKELDKKGKELDIENCIQTNEIKEKIIGLIDSVNNNMNNINNDYTQTIHHIIHSVFN